MSEPTNTYVCPNCSAVNRVPVSRNSEEPICGKCKQKLLADHPVELNDGNFQKFVSRTSVPVVVDFWAPWCGPCRMMAPAFAEAATQLKPNIILAKLNTDEFPQSAAGFNISGIPCLIAFKSGREITRQAGAMNAQQIVQWVKSI